MPAHKRVLAVAQLRCRGRALDGSRDTTHARATHTAQVRLDMSEYMEKHANPKPDPKP